MNNSEKEKLLSSIASQNKNIDKKALHNAIKSGDKNTLINSLSEEDRKKLNSVLNDKAALSAALKSPEAQALMKSLFGGKNE